MASPASPASLASKVRVHPSMDGYKDFVTAVGRFNELDLGPKFLFTHQVPFKEAVIMEVTVELTACSGETKPIAEALVAFLKAKNPDWDPVLCDPVLM